MTGRLVVVGLGPGDAALVTPEAETALAEATAAFGYGPYLARVADRPGLVKHVSDNREEISRASAALAAALAGERVVVVSGGDPGVFAMAAAVCEAVETGPQAWRTVEISVLPGVTAMLALAARTGAPLGHDFCALSLSDNLKPWATVERRLAAAAEAGFAIALYNPISKARPWQLGAALDRLRAVLPAATPVIFGRAVRRPEETVAVTTIAEARAADADMATLIIVGSPETRVVERPGLPPLVYSPRSAGRATPSALGEAK